MPDVNVPQTKLAQLRQVLDEVFNESELRTLCFDLGIEYEHLSGEERSAKTRELVAYCERTGSQKGSMISLTLFPQRGCPNT